MARGTTRAGPVPAGAAGGGELLAGRYRLAEKLTERDESAVWRATDEVLARTVAVRTFAPGFARAAEVAAAARAVCKLNDPRLLQIFDVDEGPPHPYLVTEWPSGTQLSRLLAAGPLEPLRAARIIAEAADALAAASAAGLAHLSLTPESLWCTSDDDVKISGVGTIAALSAAQAGDPAQADTRGLASLLYAALTGYWPGTERTSLPPAPHSRGRPSRPRQLRPGIPPAADAVTCRALFGEAERGKPAIRGPAQLAMELAAAARSLPRLPSPPPDLPAAPPEPAPAPPAPTLADVAPPAPTVADAAVLAPTIAGAAAPAPASGSPDAPAQDRAEPAVPGLSLPGLTGAGAAGTAARAGPRQGRPARAPRALVIVTGLLVLAAVGVWGWLLTSHAAAPHAAAPPRNLVPVSVTTFDPYGDGQGENKQLAPLAIDASTATAWRSNWYTSARLGNLKPGVGLLLDMGHPVQVTRALVTLGAAGGASFQVRAGATGGPLADLATAGHADNVGARVRVVLPAAPRGRYVLIWFTRLPPSPSGTFQVRVYDIRLQGRAG